MAHWNSTSNQLILCSNQYNMLKYYIHRDLLSIIYSIMFFTGQKNTDGLSYGSLNIWRFYFILDTPENYGFQEILNACTLPVSF